MTWTPCLPLPTASRCWSLAGSSPPARLRRSVPTSRCAGPISARTRQMLSVRGLETFYGVSQVLFGLALDVAGGEVVTLLGRNGMGKTTTINSIMGIVRPRNGSIRFDGQEVTRLPSFRTAKLGLG